MRSDKVRNSIRREAEQRLEDIYHNRKVNVYQFKKILAFHLASILHDEWKEEDLEEYENATKEEKKANWEIGPNREVCKFESVDQKVRNGYYKDSVFIFKEDDPAYRKKERKVDIRALDFKELPFALKKIYEERGYWVMDLLYEEVIENGEKDVNKLLANSESYKKLSEESKEKYKMYANLGYGLLKEIREGELILKEMLIEEGIPMLEFQIQKERILKVTKGILPKNPEWEEITKISPKDIAEADKDKAITTNETKGFRKFWENIKNKFKGVGEK